VVGKSTASSLHAIRAAHPNSPFVPSNIRGESSGTSEQLARFILSDLKSSSTPLLYLTGDKNRDTLPDILRDGSLKLAPLQVYQTQGSSRFSEELKLALEATSDGTWLHLSLCLQLLSLCLRSQTLVDRILRAFGGRICHAPPATSLRSSLHGSYLFGTASCPNSLHRSHHIDLSTRKVEPLGGRRGAQTYSRRATSSDHGL
jgi:hypothetical protein